MLRASCILTLALAGFFAGCATYPRNCTTLTSPAGQELLVVRSPAGWLCCLHHVPLITARGFSPRYGLIVDADEVEYQASLKWPNFLKAGWDLKRSNDICTPATLMYCPKCEEELHRVRQRNPSNHAMQRTASKPATTVVSVCHPPFHCVGSHSGLAVADLGSR